MQPWLFHIGDFSVPSYWALVMIGFMAAIYFSWREARHDGLAAERLLDLSLILLLAGVLGARLMHILAEDDPLRQGQPILYHYLKNPADMFRLWNGLAFYGGLVLCTPLGLWYARRKKMSFGKVADIYAVAVPLGLIFGRMGCFLAGCCHGSPTDLPIGVTFTDPHSLARPLGLALHPSQLYAAGFALFLFGLLWMTKRNYRRFEGQIFLYFLALYSAGRFLLEFLRNDNRGMFFGRFLSSSQVVAVAMIAVSIVLLFVLGRRNAGDTKQADR